MLKFRNRNAQKKFISLSVWPALASGRMPSPSCSCARGEMRAENDCRVAYEDSVYCFNQRSIVTFEGKKGVVGEQGELILAPEWDAIEFLDDEVALLQKSGLYYLCTRDGRIFAESHEMESLERSFRQRLAEMHDADVLSWNRVLDQLEVLCDACLACDGRKPDSQLIHEDTVLREYLNNATGAMNQEQKLRLERIGKKFDSLYR